MRNGDEDLGGDDESGSSIHEKLDCAIVERVGTGALGLDGVSPPVASSVGGCCKSIDGIVLSVVVIASSTRGCSIW